MGTNSPQVALFYALFSKNIAKFKAQNEGRPQATYGDMVNVFEELEKQQQLKKQAQQTSGGYNSGM